MSRPSDVVQPGRLRRRVNIEVATLGAKDSFGAQAKTWAVKYRNVPAEVQFVSGQELERARQIHEEATVTVKTRYLSDATSAQRLIYGALVLNVHSVIPSDRHTHHTWFCSQQETEVA